MVYGVIWRRYQTFLALNITPGATLSLLSDPTLECQLTTWDIDLESSSRLILLFFYFEVSKTLIILGGIDKLKIQIIEES